MPLNWKRKLAAAACCAAVVFGLIAQMTPAGAIYAISENVGFTINSKAYYLYNLDTDTPVVESHSQDPFIPASTVKIMTAILALENCDDLDATFTYPEYIFDTLNGTGASAADVRSGEEMTMRKALYCLMLQSDCYSAMAIADQIGGDQETFVSMMNEKAKEIKAVNTTFTNPHGLLLTEADNSMTTTAYDLSLIAKYAMQVEGFMDYAGTPTIDISPTNIHESNYLLISTIYPMLKSSPDYYYAPMKGIKTGSLPEVGMNLVTTASQDGYNYLLVLMGADYYYPNSGTGTEGGKRVYEENGETRPIFRDAVNIFEWAFEYFEVRQLYQKGEQVTEIPVRLAKGEEDFVRLVAADDFSALVNKDAVLKPEDGTEGIVEKKHLPEYIEAPVKAGERVGYMDLLYSGVLGSIDLLAEKSVDRSQSKLILSKVKELFEGFWIKFTIVLVVLVVAVYVTLMVLRNRYRKRYRRARGRRK